MGLRGIEVGGAALWLGYQLLLVGGDHALDEAYAVHDLVGLGDRVFHYKINDCGCNAVQPS